MSKPKTYPPYSVTGEGCDAWIIDSKGNDVVSYIGLGEHYANSEIRDTIMQTLCDALNRKEESK